LVSKLSARDRKALATLDELSAQLADHPVAAAAARRACGRITLTDLEARRLQLTTSRKPRTVLRDDGLNRCIYLSARERCSACVFAQDAPARTQ
jgi:hypothetical protein